MNYPPALNDAVANHPYPLLFATISGAHLYGFPSPDSDYDLRGVHVLPIGDVIGLETGTETVQVFNKKDGLELDLVTHDLKKFSKLLLTRNGYVLEQLCSPLVVQTTEVHAELLELAPRCITRHHAHHYLGFAATQWRLFENEKPQRIKPLLYVYRVLLTGIHLMKTGETEANLLTLNEQFKLPYIGDLIERKTSGKEKQTLEGTDLEFHLCEYHRLRTLLEESFRDSRLPETPSARAGLDDLLKRVRMNSGANQPPMDRSPDGIV